MFARTVLPKVAKLKSASTAKVNAVYLSFFSRVRIKCVKRANSFDVDNRLLM